MTVKLRCIIIILLSRDYRNAAAACLEAVAAEAGGVKALTLKYILECDCEIGFRGLVDLRTANGLQID